MENENWLDKHLDELEPGDFYCAVKKEPTLKKIQEFCRIRRCPNLLVKGTLENKPGTVFGKREIFDLGFTVEYFEDGGDYGRR